MAVVRVTQSLISEDPQREDHVRSRIRCTTSPEAPIEDPWWPPGKGASGYRAVKAAQSRTLP